MALRRILVACGSAAAGIAAAIATTGLAACGGGGHQSEIVSESLGAVPRESETTTAEVPRDSLVRETLEARGFRLGGRLVDVQRGGPASTNVAAVRFAASRDTERIVIALGPGGAGHVGAEFLRDLGIVRIHLTSATSTAVTDTVLNGRLAGPVYVVRAPDRSLYVDIHLWTPVFARALVLDAPGRVVVDVTPGGPPLPQPATRARNVVVLLPRSGPATYPVHVFGYARTFEANVIAYVEHPGPPPAVVTTMAADWSETWGEFSLVIPRGAPGAATLFVGEHSAATGEPVGVRINLLLR